MSPGAFRRRVYRVVRCIPEGRVLGYGDVAALAGHPGAARQVGYALAALRHGGDDQGPVPWQRVVRSTGHIALGGDPGRGPLQRRILEEEGVAFEGERIDMARHRWQPGLRELPCAEDSP